MSTHGNATSPTADGTLRTPRELRATVAVEPVKIPDDRMISGPNLRLKRQSFEYAVECTDAALILAQGHSKQGKASTAATLP
jgi:hypothetical protein